MLGEPCQERGKNEVAIFTDRQVYFTVSDEKIDLVCKCVWQLILRALKDPHDAGSFYGCTTARKAWMHTYKIGYLMKIRHAEESGRMRGGSRFKSIAADKKKMKEVKAK